MKLFFKHSRICHLLSPYLLTAALTLILTGCTSNSLAAPKQNLIESLTLEKSSLDSDYYVVSNPDKVSIYKDSYQDTIEHLLTEAFNDKPTEENPLLVLNPYGTNISGMYISFTTKQDVTISYEISVKEDGYANYSNTLASDGVSKKHEGQIIGLIQNMENELTIKLHDKNGTFVSEHTFLLTLPENSEETPLKFDATVEPNAEKLSNGLYVIFGYNRTDNTSHHLLFYDNNGILRAEFPITVGCGDVALEFVDGNMLYTYTDRKFCLVNPLGKVLNTYEIEGYRVHHDFAFDGDHTVLMLVDDLSENATTVEDLVMSLDLETGESKIIVDMKDLMPDIKERAIMAERDTQLDWIHLNTIDFVSNSSILLSSRELSTIIKLDNIYESPTIDYLIAEPKIWEGTPYENLLLTKQGDFPSQGGQHTVTYLEDDSLKQGQYYIYCFNNNYGYSGGSWTAFDWSVIEGVGMPANHANNSQYYKYLVDTNTKSYSLVKEIQLPYSSIVSSVQDYGNNMVFCAGYQAKAFGECDYETGEILSQFNLNTKSYTYRVYKYTLKDFWF